MSQEAEMLDVFDAEGKIIDTVTREEAEKNNYITQNVLVFIFNAEGKVWLQLRPKNKAHYPGVWDISACGGIMSGETKEEAARRETLEETSISPTLKYVESFLNVFPGENGEQRKRLSHLYIGNSDEEPKPGDDTDDFKLWDPDELRTDALKNPQNYVPSLLLELDKALSSIKSSQ